MSAQSAFIGAYVVSHALLFEHLLERIRDALEQFLVQMYLTKGNEGKD